MRQENWPRIMQLKYVGGASFTMIQAGIKHVNTLQENTFSYQILLHRKMLYKRNLLGAAGSVGRSICLTAAGVPVAPEMSYSEALNSNPNLTPEPLWWNVASLKGNALRKIPVALAAFKVTMKFRLLIWTFTSKWQLGKCICWGQYAVKNISIIII